MARKDDEFMITITPCTSADSPTIATLWNHMAGIADSCWYQAQTISAADVTGLLDAGLTFVLASDEQPLGFAFWGPAGAVLRLRAIAAETVEVYYRLLVACTEWGIDRGFSEGFCEISPRQTSEMGWMTALEAIQLEPVGREPLVEGQDPALRAALWLRAKTNLAAARQAALDELGG
jgi:hypothetical protein